MKTFCLALIVAGTNCVQAQFPPNAAYASAGMAVCLATNFPLWMSNTNLSSTGAIPSTPNLAAVLGLTREPAAAGSSLFADGLRRKSPRPQSLPPGIYTTSPYAGIVLVPGPQRDDHCVHPAGPTVSMPILKPELHFIPRPPKQ